MEKKFQKILTGKFNPGNENSKKQFILQSRAPFFQTPADIKSTSLMLLAFQGSQASRYDILRRSPEMTFSESTDRIVIKNNKTAETTGLKSALYFQYLRINRSFRRKYSRKHFFKHVRWEGVLRERGKINSVRKFKK